MREGVDRVALCLFEHNEKAYHAAVRMMDQYGKAAIVHPTGTGKSYIAFKLIEDKPECLYPQDGTGRLLPAPRLERTATHGISLADV